MPEILGALYLYRYMTAGKQYISPYFLGLLLFILSLAVAIFTFRDYGMSWDEYIQRGLGNISYDYVTKGDTLLKHYEDRAYGSAFEMLLIKAEQQFHLTDTRQVFFMRHFITHLLFLLSAFCGFVLIQRLFKNGALSCLGFILLVYHPRLYAQSFFNTKDIPFLSFVLISMLLAHIAFAKNKAGWFALLGIACGCATGTRIMGILPAAIFSVFLVADIIGAAIARKSLPVSILNFLVFTVFAWGTTYAIWPILWEAPLQNFVSSFNYLSHFPWTGELLFNGHVYQSKALPWFYLPGWFSVTTPVLWLFCGFAGIVMVLVSFIRKPLTYLANTPERNYLLYGLFIFTPVLSVIILHSVVYDDWRHIYFTYPSFVILALYCINKLISSRARIATYFFCTAQLLVTGIFIVESHPFQQVYFNELVSHKDQYLRKHYDLDYWGCAYRQGLEYILAHDTASSIKVLCSLLPVENNLKMLLPEQRKRIELVGKAGNPQYFITNFRTHPQDYDYPVIFYEIKVENSTIMRVYKLR